MRKERPVPPRCSRGRSPAGAERKRKTPTGTANRTTWFCLDCSKSLQEMHALGAKISACAKREKGTSKWDQTEKQPRFQRCSANLPTKVSGYALPLPLNKKEPQSKKCENNVARMQRCCFLLQLAACDRCLRSFLCTRSCTSRPSEESMTIYPAFKSIKSNSSDKRNTIRNTTWVIILQIASDQPSLCHDNEARTAAIRLLPLSFPSFAHHPCAKSMQSHNSWLVAWPGLGGMEIICFNQTISKEGHRRTNDRICGIISKHYATKSTPRSAPLPGQPALALQAAQSKYGGPADVGHVENTSQATILESPPQPVLTAVHSNLLPRIYLWLFRVLTI